MADYVINNGGWVSDYCIKLRAVSSTPMRELSLKMKKEQAEIDDIKKNNKIRKYWEMNSDERKQLEGMERALTQDWDDLTMQVKKLEKDIASILEKEKMYTVSKMISDKQFAISKLGFFKRKEKTVLQEEIVQLQKEYDALERIKESKENEIYQQINGLKASIRMNENKRNKIKARLANPIDNIL